MHMNRKYSSALGIGILIGLQIIVGIIENFDNNSWLLFGIISIVTVVILGYKIRHYFYICIGIALGIIRIFFWHPYMAEIMYGKFENTVHIEGVISSFPEVKNGNTEMILNIKNIDSEKNLEYSRIILKLPHYRAIQRGERVSLQGTLQSIQEKEDSTYKEYLERKYIYGIVETKNAEVIEEANIFWKIIGHIRSSVSNHIDTQYQYPYDGFLEGLLLGSKYGLSQKLSEAFRITGLTHIIAISGYNITLIVMIMSSMFGFLGRYAKVILSIIAVCVFTVLVGAEASVVRACIMGVVSLLGLYFGRPTYVWGSLLWAMVCMTWYEPRTFLFDVGFQLSVVATIGVVSLSKICIRWFSFLPNIFEIRESFAITIAAQITTLPILIYHFGNISFISPIANVMVAPFLPWAMLLGCMEIALTWIPFIPEILLFGGEMILKIISFIAIQLSAIPYAQIQVKHMSFILLSIIYIALLFIISRIVEREMRCAALRL